MKKIDVHSHIFDLNFLPVAGSIRGISKNFKPLPNGVPVFLCRLIAWYYLKKMKDGGANNKLKPSVYKSFDQNFDDLFDINVISKVGFSFESQEEEREFYEFINQEVGDVRFKDIEISEKVLRAANLNASNKVSDLLNQDKKNKSFLAIPWSRVLWLVVKYLGKKLYRKHLKPHLDWFNFMTNRYTKITESLFKEYPDIDIFIHHDMDMDDWYELAPPTYSYDQQVEKVSALAKKHAGKLIPFYAYNPKADITKLEVAILGSKKADGTRGESKGYKGVKFYPPSGYKPWYDNQDDPYQKSNLVLFQLCEENNIPVFTHCNYGGMQAGKDTWRNNNVEYWKTVLVHFPKLKLCFGHSGGDEGWLGEFDHWQLESMGHDTFEKSFPGQIYQLSITYENVYCDFGYLPEVVDTPYRDGSEARNKIIGKLHECFENSGTAPYQFQNKIMYGTDWHMLMKDHGYEDYYSTFSKMFDDPRIDSHKNNFFGGNAMKYLGLEE